MAKKILARIDFKKESGEIVLTKNYPTELQAQEQFDKLQLYKGKLTFEGLVMNLTEHFTGANIGRVDLVVTVFPWVGEEKEYCRRTLYRNA